MQQSELNQTEGEEIIRCFQLDRCNLHMNPKELNANLQSV